ncbi:hypothetical protein MTP03_22450 [Tsukamurella sp. PLM1]|nr:hypothetical protein MTP03_22450 [Tsukamurella sp. PLM1]
MIVNAYGAVSATDPLGPMTIERRDPGPHDVQIAVRYAGICHSDIHTVRSEWGPLGTPWSPATRSRARSRRSAPT